MFYTYPVVEAPHMFIFWDIHIKLLFKAKCRHSKLFLENCGCKIILIFFKETRISQIKTNICTMIYNEDKTIKYCNSL
jgi:hypothetical protein